MTDANQSRSKGPLVLSILIITLGVGWLLHVKGIHSDINWVWTLGLGVVGLLTFVLSGGVDKLSIVVGPLLIVGSILSVLRQTGQLDENLEVPIMVILIGVLLFLAQLSIVPPPRWFEVQSSGDGPSQPGNPAKPDGDAVRKSRRTSPESDERSA